MKRWMNQISISVMLTLMAVWICSLAWPLSVFAGEIPPVVKQALPKVEIRSVDTIEMGSPFYSVVTPQGVVYLDGSGRYLFTGELYDLVAQENLSQTQRGGTQQIRFDDLPLSDAIAYKKGKHRIAIFADPDCPYCRKLHPEVAQLDAEVYIFLFPLSELHPLAYRKSVSIWCSQDRIAALDDAMSGKVIPAQNCEHPVDRIVSLGTKLGLRATPTIILEDGQMLEGYRPVRELARLLEKDGP